MSRFHHWVHLNEEGKKLYGAVFSDGIVPVQSMLPSKAILGGKTQLMFKVDLKQLSREQMNKLVDFISLKFQAPKEAIKKQRENDGFIPLKADLTSSAGTDQLLFI